MLLGVTAAIYGVSVSRARHWIEPQGEIIGRDFLAFYMAGDLAAAGRWHELYDLRAQAEYQNAFMADINPQWASTCLYLNPPHYAWAMSWIGRWGYGPSLLIWTAASMLCFAATMCIWRRWVRCDANQLFEGLLKPPPRGGEGRVRGFSDALLVLDSHEFLLGCQVANPFVLRVFLLSSN